MTQEPKMDIGLAALGLCAASYVAAIGGIAGLIGGMSAGAFIANELVQHFSPERSAVARYSIDALAATAGAGLGAYVVSNIVENHVLRSMGNLYRGLL